MGYRPRRRHIIGYSRPGGGVGYFRQRKNSVIFLGMFLAGLVFSSLYSVKDGSGGGLILTMATNHIEVQAVSGYWELLTGCLGENLGYVVFLYFAANCVQGRWLIPLAPLCFGLSVGAVVTSLLYQHGLGAMAYILICVLVPRFLYLVLLMAVCNQAMKLSQGISSQKPAGERLFLVFGVIAALLSLLEALVLYRFTGLLTYL